MIDLIHYHDDQGDPIIYTFLHPSLHTLLKFQYQVHNNNQITNE